MKRKINSNWLFVFGIFNLIIVFSACQKETSLTVNGPSPTPNLPVQNYNYGTGNDMIATLGRVLFYDKNLSFNNSISCGSCHKQEFAFADNHQFSKGLNNGLTSRNSSTIISDFTHHKFWDGRAGNLDTAVFMPVQNHLEMNTANLNTLPLKLLQTNYYKALFKSAYGDSTINVARIRQALSTFVGSFRSFNSKYDRSINLVGILNPKEELGKSIFFGKGLCYNCHSSTNFNGYNSIYEDIGLNSVYSDKGRSKITGYSNDEGKFQVPTLRNIALTAPYMHDGRYKTLAEVIEHYNSGIQNSKNLSYVFREGLQIDRFGFLDPNTDPTSLPVRKLGLTEVEKKALEAFLNTLTDVSFVSDPKFSNPF